jgi:hypothetical protein
MIQEGNMGEWKTVFEDEIEGRLVAVKVYQSDEEGEDDSPTPVRVTTTSLDDYPGTLEQDDNQMLLMAPEEAGRLITLEPTAWMTLKGS